MPVRKLFAMAAMLALTAGCYYGPRGLYGRSASFGIGSHVLSHYVLDGSGDPIPVCHVLFVPQWDPPRINHGFQFGTGGDVRQYTFRLSYREQDITLMEVEPITVFRRSVLEAGDRRFDLDDGNVFVVAVNRAGSLRVSQLSRLEGVPQPNEILAHVKAGLPDDPRVQMLEATPPWGANQAS